MDFSSWTFDGHYLVYEYFSFAHFSHEYLLLDSVTFEEGHHNLFFLFRTLSFSILSQSLQYNQQDEFIKTLRAMFS